MFRQLLFLCFFSTQLIAQDFIEALSFPIKTNYRMPAIMFINPLKRAYDILVDEYSLEHVENFLSNVENRLAKLETFATPQQQYFESIGFGKEGLQRMQQLTQQRVQLMKAQESSDQDFKSSLYDVLRLELQKFQENILMTDKPVDQLALQAALLFKAFYTAPCCTKELTTIAARLVVKKGTLTRALVENYPCTDTLGILTTVAKDVDALKKWSLKRTMQKLAMQATVAV